MCSEERRALEEKYEALYAPLYDKRAQVVNGAAEAPENETGAGARPVARLLRAAGCEGSAGGQKPARGEVRPPAGQRGQREPLRFRAAAPTDLPRPPAVQPPSLRPEPHRPSLPSSPSPLRPPRTPRLHPEEGKAAAAAAEGEVPAGVPDFWMIALRNAMEEETVGWAAACLGKLLSWCRCV